MTGLATFARSAARGLGVRVAVGPGALNSLKNSAKTGTRSFAAGESVLSLSPSLPPPRVVGWTTSVFLRFLRALALVPRGTRCARSASRVIVAHRLTPLSTSFAHYSVASMSSNRRRKERDLRRRHHSPRLDVAQGPRRGFRRSHVVSFHGLRGASPVLPPPQRAREMCCLCERERQCPDPCSLCPRPRPGRFWIFYRLRCDYDTFLFGHAQHFEHELAHEEEGGGHH